MTDLQFERDSETMFERICKHMCEFAVIPDENPSLMAYIRARPIYLAVYLTLKQTLESGRYRIADDEIIDFPEYPSAVATFLLGYGRPSGYSVGHSDIDRFLEIEHSSKK